MADVVGAPALGFRYHGFPETGNTNNGGKYTKTIGSTDQWHKLLNQMQAHIYEAKKGRVFSQSIYIWLFVALHIAADVMTIPTLVHRDQIWGIFLLNIILGAITVPSVLLFINYYKHSAGKQFIVTYQSLQFVDIKTGHRIELNNADIDKINYVQNKKMSRMPWIFHEYFSFTDNKKNRITVTSYFMDMTDFWQDTLARRVNSDKLIIEEKLYPIIC